MKKFIWRGLTYSAAVLLSLSIGASQIMESWRQELDGFFGTHSLVTVTTDDGELWSAFTPDAEYLKADGKGDSSKIVKKHKDFGELLSEEGSVLLKNENLLPITKASPKVTLLGIRSHVILAGSGMGVSANAGQVVQLESALADRGFMVNPVMSAVYDTANETAKLTNNDRAAATNYNPKEPSLDSLRAIDDDFEDSFEEYKDACIVVIGRPSSEMGDYAPGAAGVDSSTGASTAMALTTNELDMIELATSKFDNVIVLVNTNSAMEIDALKNNNKIKSILWVGHPGCYGVYGIADILKGNAVPSGHLYDTYAADSLSAPAMQNMGNFQYANNSSDFTRTPTNGSNDKYVIEAESIYTGYKYYETRYEDVVLNRGNAASVEKGAFKSTDKWSYAKEVSYPFGFGLSYTTFTQTIERVEYAKAPHDFTATLTVKVKNTGDKAAKDVVQVYGQAPYIPGGIEKASVQLLNFDKTPVIEPGKEHTLTIEVDFQNLASWDSSALDGKGSYILDKGDYYFAIGNGSHEAINNILANKGKAIADGMDAEGNSAKAVKYTYNYSGGDVDETTFNVTKAGTQVSNQLQTADWNYFEPNKITYLSRNNWTGTWPQTYTNLTAPANMLKYINGHVYEITEGDVSGILFNQDNGLKFTDLKGVDYNDELWTKLLDQLDLKEAVNFILHGNRELLAMNSVGFLAGRYTENGPNGIGGRGFGSLSYNNFGETKPTWYIDESDENASFGMNIFPSAPVVASTFNPEIAYEQGRLIGNDALFVGLPILWGPGMNTHRHPYNGRSGEYYSEDGIVTGVMGMEFAIGALDKGLIAAPKHYAFNDQEQNRTGIAPFMTEQKARETELRAYQIAFEATKYDKERNQDVGMLGTMTSFSKIGPTEVTCSQGMIKGILNGEWGFNGYVVSDMNDDGDLLTETLIAGLTSFDATLTLGSNPKIPTEDILEQYKKDPQILQAIKDAVHKDLYVLSQSNYMNSVNSSSYTKSVMVSWRIGYVVAISCSAALTAAFAVLWIIPLLKGKKKEA